MSIKPKNFGVIVRTVAEGKRVAELDGELKVLAEALGRCYCKSTKSHQVSDTDLRRNQPRRRFVARLVQSFLRKHPREQRGCVQRNQGLRNTHRP